MSGVIQVDRHGKPWDRCDAHLGEGCADGAFIGVGVLASEIDTFLTFAEAHPNDVEMVGDWTDSRAPNWTQSDQPRHAIGMQPSG